RKAYESLADEGEASLAKFVETRTKLKAAMVLSEEDAVAFARKTTQGVETVQRRYIKALTMGELTGHAVRGLYKVLELPVPAEIEERLKTIKEANEDQIKEVLVKTRLHLGKREDLEGVKDTDMALGAMMAA